MGLRELAPKFCKEAGHETVQWGLAIKVLKRIFTAFPWWDDKDVLRVARMAYIENGGRPVVLYRLSPANARRLYALAEETGDGRFYDARESSQAARVFEYLMKAAEKKGQ